MTSSGTRLRIVLICLDLSGPGGGDARANLWPVTGANSGQGGCASCKLSLTTPFVLKLVAAFAPNYLEWGKMGGFSMKWEERGTVNLFKLFLRGKANGTAPCQELPTISPLCGEVQAHFPLGLWLLSSRVAQLTLSFVFCLSARRFLTAFLCPQNTEQISLKSLIRVVFPHLTLSAQAVFSGLS